MKKEERKKEEKGKDEGGLIEQQLKRSGALAAVEAAALRSKKRISLFKGMLKKVKYEIYDFAKDRNFDPRYFIPAINNNRMLPEYERAIEEYLKDMNEKYEYPDEGVLSEEEQEEYRKEIIDAKDNIAEQIRIYASHKHREIRKR